MVTDWVHRRVVVMGLGRFGGGAGAARFLSVRGADVLVTDLEPAERFCHQGLEQLRQLPITYRFGGHEVADFTNADLIVVNPAVDRRRNRFLQAAVDAGASLTSEIRLLVAHLPNRRRTIGVTGTAGKSTVTAMIGHLVKKGRSDPDEVRSGSATKRRSAWVGGNLGGSLLECVDQIGPEDWIVLELSSFMLEGLDEDRWSPGTAVVTNFSPNHLDRHGTLVDYAAAKQVILEHQRPGDTAILGATIADWPTKCGVERRVIEDRDVPIDLAVPGRHNRFNALCAIAAAQSTEAADLDLTGALADFPGLPHRLQFVCEHGGVKYVNDSKSTTPESALLALGSFEPGIVHAILGGYDKGSDLGPLADFASEHCRAIYTIGATGDVIAGAVRDRGEVVRCGELKRAVAEAVRRARRGDIVLLSPACASWDQFDNFEGRGATFLEAVLQCTGEESRVQGPGS